MFENINLSSDMVNQLGLLGAVAIVALTVVIVAKYIRQIKNETSTGELAEEKWDGIGEYKNPIPVGWAVSFVGAIIWTIWYWLLGYPLNAYSQIGEYNEEVKTYNAAYEEKWKNPSDETLQEMGEGIFLVECASCHGITGDGINGKAQNFEHRMEIEDTLNVIANGQDFLKYPMGAMPGGMASGDDAQAIAEWLYNNGQGEAPAAFAACASCHGEDGHGLGGQAPNITGYDDNLIRHVLEHGKTGTMGHMPAYNDGRLNEVQKQAVSVYIRSLAKQ